MKGPIERYSISVAALLCRRRFTGLVLPLNFVVFVFCLSHLLGTPCILKVPLGCDSSSCSKQITAETAEATFATHGAMVVTSFGGCIHPPCYSRFWLLLVLGSMYPISVTIAPRPARFSHRAQRFHIRLVSEG